MKIALQGTTLLIKDADNVQFTVIKSWGKMRWDKKTQTLSGTADIELLERLSSIVRLPPAPAQRLAELHSIQDAVDRERVKEKASPFYNYPVKMPLYDHQSRVANMALLTFGWVPPEAAGTGVEGV